MKRLAETSKEEKVCVDSLFPHRLGSGRWIINKMYTTSSRYGLGERCKVLEYKKKKNKKNCMKPYVVSASCVSPGAIPGPWRWLAALSALSGAGDTVELGCLSLGFGQS